MNRLDTDWARSSAAGAVRTAILRFGFTPLLRSVLDLRIAGHDALASLAPPAIFVANHSSHLDAPLVLTSLPPRWRERIAVGAAADYFFDVWWKAAATALAFNGFPVDRRGRRRSAGFGAALLEEGWSLLVFPEGSRARDGRMAGFRLGAASLAIEAGVPAVPVALSGAYQAMPPGQAWPSPGRPRVSVRFGVPCRARVGDRPAAFSRRLEMRLQALLEEERGTWWDSLRAASPLARRPSALADVARWRRLWESTRPGGRSASWRR